MLCGVSLVHDVLTALAAAAPVVALIDDTLVRKRGRHITGTSWRRDPLGPHFADNFIWASRFLQLSSAVPAKPGATASGARAIAIDLVHSPSPTKAAAPRDARAVAGLAHGFRRIRH